ncbi:MAG: UDP-glucose 4-epimerase GalE [Chloroflexi bacterium]|nr:UDP-glucose 4-epimerase GalE [Chloroflexota bacterium]
MHVLVTGGAGYIGSITAAELLRAGYRVTVYDNLRQGHRLAVPEEAQFVAGDLSQPRKLRQLFKTHDIDAVMHFAALSLVGQSMQTPERYFRNNVVGSLNLLEATLAAGVKRFVLSSTAAVYGNPEKIPIHEGDRLAPVNPYGETKLAVEQMLRWFDQVHGLRFASLRYFNASGATPERGEDHDPEAHLIPLVLQVARGQRDHLEIYGTDYATPDGTCIRDYIHVLDLASAHILALEALDKGSRIYNLGNGQGFSVRQVLHVARDVTGHPIPAHEAPRRLGDPPILVASAAAIQRELGWRPRIPDLRDIIQSAWSWHQKHPNGY